MSKYKMSDFEIGEEVIITHSVLNGIEHKTRGRIVRITSEKLKSGILVLRIGESKYMREIPIIYINDVQVIKKNVQVVNKNVDKDVEIRIDKYEKLTQDLYEAKEVAIKLSEGVHDGGTANLDSTFLILKNWKEEKVIESIKKAGLWSSGKRQWVGPGYFISINTGQANKRTFTRNQFMSVLKNKGYQVMSFDKID